MTWLSKPLKIGNLEDWYRVSFEQINRIAPSTPFQSKGMANMLNVTYPDHIWDLNKLQLRSGPNKASQRMLAAIVREILPHAGRLVGIFRIELF